MLHFNFILLTIRNKKKKKHWFRLSLKWRLSDLIMFDNQLTHCIQCINICIFILLLVYLVHKNIDCQKIFDT